MSDLSLSAEKESTIEAKVTAEELDKAGYDMKECGGGIDALFKECVKIYGHDRLSVQYSFKDGTLTVEEIEEDAPPPAEKSVTKESLLSGLRLKESDNVEKG